MAPWLRLPHCAVRAAPRTRYLMLVPAPGTRYLALADASPALPRCSASSWASTARYAVLQAHLRLQSSLHSSLER